MAAAGTDGCAAVPHSQTGPSGHRLCSEMVQDLLRDAANRGHAPHRVKTGECGPVKSPLTRKGSGCYYKGACSSQNAPPFPSWPQRQLAAEPSSLPSTRLGARMHKGRAFQGASEEIWTGRDRDGHATSQGGGYSIIYLREEGAGAADECSLFLLSLRVTHRPFSPAGPEHAPAAAEQGQPRQRHGESPSSIRTAR